MNPTRRPAKPGFWNRLAVVAAGLTLLVAPVAGLLSANSEYEDRRQVAYEHCLNNAEAIHGDDYDGLWAAQKRCMDTRYDDRPDRPGWDYYGSFLLLTAALCALLYGLAFLSIRVARWVWNGRAREEKM